MAQNDEVIYFTCLGSGDHGIPPHTPRQHVITWPGFTRNYEIHTPNGHYGGKNDWKNFEHFRSTQGEFSSSMLPVYTEKWSFNPHVQKGYSNNMQAGYHLKWNSSELLPYGSPGALNNGLPRWDTYQSDGHFVPEPPQLDKLISNSLRAMMPGIKSELSTLNSLWELKDFSGIAKMASATARSVILLNQRVNLIKPVLDAAKIAWRVGWKATLRDLTQKTASGFLGWKFAIEPLLSDISAIHRAMSVVERRVNDLITRSGRVQRRHYGVSFIEHPDSYESGSNPGYFDFPWKLSSVGLYDVDRRVNYQPTVFHAEIEYNYYLTQYQTAHARMLGYLDALGVNLNPSVIWNALPWSFVVDWVAGLNRWLDSMKTTNMEPMINIRRYLWSVRRSRSIYVSRGIVRSYYGLPPEQRAHMPVVTETAYRREVGIPDWNSFYTSGISSKEAVLGAALVIARRRRRNRG